MNTLVLVPGGYRLGDLFEVEVLLPLLVLAVTVVLASFILAF